MVASLHGGFHSVVVVILDVDDEFGCLLIQSLGESLNVSDLDGSPQLYTLEKRRLVLWPISCFACLRLTLPVEVVYVYIGDDEGPLLLH